MMEEKRVSTSLNLVPLWPPLSVMENRHKSENIAIASCRLAGSKIL